MQILVQITVQSPCTYVRPDSLSTYRAHCNAKASLRVCRAAFRGRPTSTAAAVEGQSAERAGSRAALTLPCHHTTMPLPCPPPPPRAAPPLPAQVTSMVRKVAIKWPKFITGLLGAGNSVSKSVTTVVSIDCSLSRDASLPISIQVGVGVGVCV